MTCRSRRVGSASAAVRPCADVRACAAAGMIDRGDCLAVVGLHLNRLLTRFDLGGVARDRPDDASPSARSISAAWILSGSSPCANSANAGKKGGLGRNLRASLPAEDATQGPVDGEALDQGAGGGNAEDRLGHESSGEGATVFGGRPGPLAGRARRLRGRSRRAW